MPKPGRERGDERAAEPIILLAFVEHHLETAKADRQQENPNVIDLAMTGGFKPAPLFGKCGRIGVELAGQEERESKPTGILMKKIQCQEELSVIQPPRVGPSAGARTIAML